MIFVQVIGDVLKTIQLSKKKKPTKKINCKKKKNLPFFFAMWEKETLYTWYLGKQYLDTATT